MRPLTVRQAQCLDFLRGYIFEHGFPPTFREAGAAMGMAVVSIYWHLRALEKKGYVVPREKGERRAISLTLKGKLSLPVMRVKKATNIAKAG